MMPKDDRTAVRLSDGNSYTVGAYTSGAEPCVVLAFDVDEVWLSPEETQALMRALQATYDEVDVPKIGGAFEARLAASRARLMPFAEDWAAPGMEAYDGEPEAGVS